MSWFYSCLIGALSSSFMLWLIKNVYQSKSHQTQRPKGFLSPFIDRFRELQFLFLGPDTIDAHYKENNGAVFALPTPGSSQVYMSSEEHIKELEQAPEDHLSLHAIAKDMFQPKYTMNGYELKEEPGANSSGHSRVLRVLLTSKLPLLQTNMQQKISEALTQEFEARKHQNGWSCIRTFSMAKKVVTKVNSCVFFGDELSRNTEFLDAAQRYPQDVFITGEVLRFVPSSFAPLTAYLCTGGFTASKILIKYLTPVVQKRLHKRKKDSRNSLDCIQWIIDSSPSKEPWTEQRVIQEVLALWFGSVHQLAMSFTYALYDLCVYPDYTDPLREELEATWRADVGWQPESMPLLDSFLKESSRLNPSDSISVRRKVLAPYSLVDGTYLEVGSWACVPQRSLMRDHGNYQNATSFHGFRFVPSPGTEYVGNASRFTDVASKFPVWGAGKRVCPGRFYASVALKMMMAHFLQNYDCKLLSNKTPRSFSWRSAIIPRSSTVLQMRRRSNASS